MLTLIVSLAHSFRYDSSAPEFFCERQEDASERWLKHWRAPNQCHQTQT